MAVDYAGLKAGGFMRQKQKNTFSMRLRCVGGTVTTEQLAAIVEAANKYGHGYIHLTARQGIEIPFIKLEDIEDIKKDLGEHNVQSGVCGPRVRTVTACQGGLCCPSGCINAYDIAVKLDARYFGRELPHKFKFGVTGCQNNCLKAEENDVGVKGGMTITWEKESCIFCGVCEKACRSGAITIEEDNITVDETKCNNCGRCVKACPTESWIGESGYLLSFGGTFGNNIEKGKEIVPIIRDEDTLFRVCDAAVQFFSDHANSGERFAKTLERVGWDGLIEKVQEAYRGEPA